MCILRVRDPAKLWEGAASLLHPQPHDSGTSSSGPGRDQQAASFPWSLPWEGGKAACQGALGRTLGEVVQGLGKSDSGSANRIAMQRP